MKLQRLLVVPAALLMVGLTALPAAASSKQFTCENRGKLTVTMQWNETTTTHTWTHAWFRLTGELGSLLGDFGDKSNVYFTMKEDGVTRFSQEAPPANAITMDDTYSFAFTNFTTSRSRDERWYVRAVFDTPWETDYECTALLDY